MTPEDEMIIEHDTIELRRPILMAAFKGWNDAGDAASFAASHIGRSWEAKRIASIDPEEFYDFQATRPQVELDEGLTRKISWPSNDFSAARLTGERDLIVLVGTEPNVRWRSFTKLILNVARRYDVSLVVTLGALLADVAHSRPVQITGTAIDPDLVARLNLQRSRYEGPTGIVGVLQDAFAKAGIQSASLWAAVPHYLAVSPNPKAALALVEKCTQLVGEPVAVDDLQRATAVYEEKVAEVVAQDEDVQAYVRLLEERDDKDAMEEMDPSRMPSGEDLAAEFERFLRNRGEEG
jgi:proteasome assembly chaperone (PAC2) family protein